MVLLLRDRLLSLALPFTAQVVFEGKIAGDFYNDMALDDISYAVESNCQFTPMNARKPRGDIVQFHLWTTSPAATQSTTTLTRKLNPLISEQDQ